MAKSNNILKRVLPILLLGGAGFAAYKTVNLSSSIDKIKFDFKDIVYKGIKSFVLNLNVRFDIVNPSNNSFTIDFISLDLILPNGKVIGQIRQPNFNKEITQTGISTLTLASKTNLLSGGMALVNEVLSFFGGGSLPNVTVKGDIRANGILLPINEIVKLSK